MIELKHVTCVYSNGVEALTDVSFRMENGEFCFIVGSSGSGKSTLSKLLSGELVASEGEVLVNGFDMQTAKGRKLAMARRTVGMVFQDFRLVPTWTVYENLEFAMICIGGRRADIGKRIGDVLEIVGLSGKEGRFPHELSGGEQQRVAIARAIINHPGAIIADEPTGNLDPRLAEEIMRLFMDICQKEHVTTIVITHAEDLVRRSGMRTVRIVDGRIASDSAVPEGGEQG